MWETSSAKRKLGPGEREVHGKCEGMRGERENEEGKLTLLYAAQEGGRMHVKGGFVWGHTKGSTWAASARKGRVCRERRKSKGTAANCRAVYWRKSAVEFFFSTISKVKASPAPALSAPTLGQLFCCFPAGFVAVVLHCGVHGWAVDLVFIPRPALGASTVHLHLCSKALLTRKRYNCLDSTGSAST